MWDGMHFRNKNTAYNDGNRSVIKERRIDMNENDVKVNEDVKDEQNLNQVPENPDDKGTELSNPEVEITSKDAIVALAKNGKKAVGKAWEWTKPKLKKAVKITAAVGIGLVALDAATGKIGILGGGTDADDVYDLPKDDYTVDESEGYGTDEAGDSTESDAE